jgi:flagellar hook-associated protein 1 FlgK
MSTSPLLSIGASAMNAAYAQLMTASNNIANASTPGYSRQSVQLANADPQSSGSGYFGRGVTVQTVQRATNHFLTQQAAATGAAAAGDAARRDLMQQLEKVFGTGASGLGAAATSVFNAFSDLAAAPADLSARQALLGKLQDFAALARSNSDALDALQAGVTQGVRASVDSLNQMLGEVAALNRRIALAQGTGQPPNDLLDQRDALVARIGQTLEVHTIGASDGSVGLFTATGQTLVLGGNANALAAQSDPFDPRRVAVALNAGGMTIPLDAQALGGGSIAGQLAFQNGDLAAARDRLGQLVASFAGMLNRQQALGIDLTGQAGGAILRSGAPTALPAAGNLAVGGQFVAQVGLRITDPTALQASDYLLTADLANPGRYQVTRLSDGQVTSNLASGDSVDGFAIDVGVALGAGDRFLLQPVGNAASGLQVALTDPRGIAAASPLTAAAASTNTGSAAVGSLAISSPPAGPAQSLTLQFTDAAGGWELLDAGGAVLSSGTLTPGQPIAYGGFALGLTGAPAAGDRFTIGPTAFAGSNNGNALAFDALASAPMVAGSSFTDAYAQTLADVGTRSASAGSAADSSAGAAAAASAALSGEVGVNLDEEAARMIQYQQSYQAAAKVLQVAQTVLDTLIQMVASR